MPRAAVAIALVLLIAAIGGRAQTPPADAAAARAVSFLVKEVPRWRADEGCYSCHNNGDAARALMAATAIDRAAIGGALADTFTWLAQPDAWNKAVVNRGVDNKVLARLQFASALADAVARGSAPKTALAEAVAMVAADQERDGSWRVDTGSNIGSPVTYGTALATALAARLLASSDAPALVERRGAAIAFLIRSTPAALPDAAAVLLGVPADINDAGVGERRRAADKLFAEQGRDGGWGPYPTVPSEPFDTALAVLALRTLPPAAARDRAISSGRAWLRSKQLADGSWPETTRPAGQVSYAQLISTTAWALLALVE